MNNNDFHEFGDVDIEPTVTVSRSYLADLVAEICAEYEGEYVAPIAFRSEALRTLWYLATEE
jgi:hypothetical protein